MKLLLKNYYLVIQTNVLKIWQTKYQEAMNMRVNVANIKPTNLFGDDENTLTKKQLLI